MSKIKQSGADLIYWGGLYTEGGLIVRQMRDQGVKAPLMGGDGITSDEFASIGGPGVEGTLMLWDPDTGQQGGRVATLKPGSVAGALALSPNGQTIARAGRAVTLRDLVTGRQRELPEAHADWVSLEACLA